MFSSIYTCVGMLSCLVMSNSLWFHGLQPARLLCPWNFLGKNTSVGCHLLLQRIFPTQGWSLHLLCLLHCRQSLYLLNHQGSPYSPKAGICWSCFRARKDKFPSLILRSPWLFSRRGKFTLQSPDFAPCIWSQGIQLDSYFLPLASWASCSGWF